MKKIFTVFLSSFKILIFSQGIETQVRDDAGAFGANVKSGFYQTLNPTNFPIGANSWWHLLDVRHTNEANNYAMQFSGSFFDQKLYFRKTNNSAFQNWYEIWHSGNLNSFNSDFSARNLVVAGSVDINANGVIPIIRGNGGYIPAGLRFVDDSYNQSGQVQEWGIFKGNTWIKGLAFMRYDAVNRCAGGICDTPLVLHDDGNITLGTSQKQIYVKAKLDLSDNLKVNGKMEAKEIKVTTTPTADFVFSENYHLPVLKDVEKHIREKKHLPEIPSATEMETEGVNVGQFQIKLLQKIEELTLYAIEQDKILKSQENRIQKLEAELIQKSDLDN